MGYFINSGSDTSPNMTAIENDAELQEALKDGKNVYSYGEDDDTPTLQYSSRTGFINGEIHVISESNSSISDQITEIQLALINLFESK